MATDDSYKDKSGNKVERTYWYPVVVKNGPVKIVEDYVTKGKEIAIEGKLTNRSWDDKDGNPSFDATLGFKKISFLSSFKFFMKLTNKTKNFSNFICGNHKYKIN